VSHPAYIGNAVKMSELSIAESEPSPARGGPSVSLGGDPLASHLTILVLAGNPERLPACLYPLPSLTGEVASLLRRFTLPCVGVLRVIPACTGNTLPGKGDYPANPYPQRVIW
jgi:hypothetical protein